MRSKINLGIISVYLLAIYCLSIVVVSTAFVLDYHFVARQSILITLFILIVTIPVSAGFFKVKSAIVAWSIFITCILYAFSFYIAGTIYDVSTDGQVYHLQTVINISDGWNPFKDSLDPNWSNNIFIQHYAKASEIAAYTIYELTGDAEAGKGFNIILIVISAILLVHITRIYKSGYEFRYKYLLLALIALNPISFHQAFSYYVDGQISSSVIILLSAIYIYQHDKKIALSIIFLTLIILTNLKFTGLIYAVFISIFGALIVLLRNKNDFLKYASTIFISMSIAVMLVGYNPYIRNTIEKGHPFYPLLGKNNVNIMVAGNAPESFDDKNVLYKMFYSNFSRSVNLHGSKYLSEPELKIPFTFKIHEWVVFKSHDVRICGFGPLWSGILVLSIIGIIVIIYYKEYCSSFLFYILITLAFIFSTILVIPEAWHARYVPQFWLIPNIITFCLLKIPIKKVIVLSRAMLVLMAINIVGTGTISFGSDIILSEEVKSELVWLKKQKTNVPVIFNSFNSNKLRMNKYSINYTELLSDSSTSGLQNYKILKIQNSNTIVYYPDTIKTYSYEGLFNKLSAFVKSSAHEK